MREFASWMNPVDERILEFLRDETVGTPKQIGDKLDKHNNYIGERCRVMVEKDLLNKPGRGVYTLAEDGERWLDEEIGKAELDDR